MKERGGGGLERERLVGIYQHSAGVPFISHHFASKYSLPVIPFIPGRPISCPQASDAPMAMSSGKQAVSIDIQTVGSLEHYQSLQAVQVERHGAAAAITRHQELLEELLQLTLCKYRGRPHWALSTNRMLQGGCGEPLRELYGPERFGLFMERRARYDPHDLFLHPAFVKIASQAAPQRYPGE